MPPALAHPGLPLGPASKYSSGPGTHVYGSEIHASLSGPVVTTSPPSTKPPTLPQISVPTLSQALHIPSRLISATNTLPAVNDIVLAKVTRLQTRQATVSILVVGDNVCADGFAGVIRKEDVRGWEIDRVVIGESFHVGDIVRGTVVSR